MMIKIWKAIAVAALTIIIVGLILTMFAWDAPCGREIFKINIILAAAMLLLGMLIEMLTDVFHKLECKYGK